MKRMTVLVILACTVFWFAGARPQAAAERAARSTHDFAVYSEYSDSDKPMQAGANTRVFNRVEVESGHSISLDKTTGVVTLKPGTYHITASSIVTFFDPATDTDGKVTNQARSWGGYCRLRYKDKPAREDPPIQFGTVNSANMLPSLIDTYLKVDKTAEIMLDHQAGEKVEGLYLQVTVGGSAAHIFARISIERL
ncbi:MAG TPA: hypothetical protein VIE43_17265 [Thermoanaerobaculia bacterium]|jgi:hypothetical protein|nr:hypothetical protein [Thermoanaerobaculia bacterium]